MSRIFNIYQDLLKQYPYLSQSVQGGILMAAGDVISQKLIEKKDKWSALRTMQFTTVGFFLIAPCLTTWYGFLEKHIGSTGTYAPLKKLAADQFAWNPVFIPIILTSIGLVQTLDVSESFRRTRRDYVDVMITSYKMWPAVQLVNFYFIPLQYQVLWVNVAALVFNTYLSWKTQTAKEE